MSPHERHRRAGRPPEEHASFGEVRRVPDLLGEQPRGRREALHGAEVGRNVPPGGELVMSTLSRQERPCAARTPSYVRAAIVPLAVAVVVVAAPAGAEWRLHLQHRVHHAERVLDERIPGSADSIANELEEPRVDDLLGGELEAL